MVFGPVVPDEQRRVFSSRSGDTTFEKNPSELVVKCSTGTASHQQSILPTDRQGHDLTLDLDTQFHECSPAGGCGAAAYEDQPGRIPLVSRGADPIDGARLEVRQFIGFRHVSASTLRQPAARAASMAR
jgi:hypothetical protein